MGPTEWELSWTESVQQRFQKLSQMLRGFRSLRRSAQGKEMICGDIARLEGVTPATVSHHLKVLADAGLIECQRKGPFVRSRAAGKTIDQYMQFLARVTQRKKSR